MPSDARALMPDSGPQVARLFGATLAVLWVAAWWSWALEAPLLLGEQGLLPLEATLAAPPEGLTPLSAPSLFWLDASGAAQHLVVGLGLVASALAAAGYALRPLLALNLVCYGSFVTVGTPFLPLLGDRLLLEATLLALLLPRNRPSPWAHLVARLLIIRLYVAAGWAHLASAGDAWHSWSLSHLLAAGPLPSWGSFALAQAPPALLSILGIALVLVELGVPWLLLGPRRLRLAAGMVLTAVQLIGVLLFNLGLFAFVTVALQLFCLGDADIDMLARDLGPARSGMRRILVHLTRPRSTAYTAQLRALLWPWRSVRAALLLAYVALGFLSVAPVAEGAGGLWAPLTHARLRLGLAAAPNFTQRKSERSEALLEVLPEGDGRAHAPDETPGSAWQPLRLWHQPSDPLVAPQLIAPHAPRLDLALGALGEAALSNPPPPLVTALARRICQHPERLGRLVRPHAWRHAQAVRVQVYRYAFAPLGEHRKTGAYWVRSAVGTGATWRCKELGKTLN